MIADNFIYCKPETKKDAVKAYEKLKKESNKVFYYGGGSEIITMARAGSNVPDAVIDIKGIPECNVLELKNDVLIIGGAVSLNDINESKLFPLLGTAGARIADHTNQCRITVGGNICGTIIYRETVLPLLLTDAKVSIYGLGRRRTLPLNEIFHERIKLDQGEFIYQIKVKKEMTETPFIHVKKTANEKIDYPLVTVCATQYKGRLRMAFSGICSYPFRSTDIEEVINNPEISVGDKLNLIHNLLPEPPLTDYEGSGEYRIFVMKNIIEKILERYHNNAKIL